MRRQYGTRLGLVVMMASVLAVAAVAQSADELVQSIQDNLEDIEVQMRVAPSGAQEDLERQKAQLDDLRRQAPEHPMLPSLERRVEELDNEITAAREEQPEAIEGEDQFVPLAAPAEVRAQLRDVETLQTRADRELMGGRVDRAEEYLSESESMINEIEAEYGDRIPPGYAALIVAKERLAALKDQLASRSQD